MSASKTIFPDGRVLYRRKVGGLTTIQELRNATLNRKRRDSRQLTNRVYVKGTQDLDGSKGHSPRNQALRTLRSNLELPNVTIARCLKAHAVCSMGEMFH